MLQAFFWWFCPCLEQTTHTQIVKGEGWWKEGFVAKMRSAMAMKDDHIVNTSKYSHVFVPDVVVVVVVVEHGR
jgi:hypothetical protein